MRRILLSLLLITMSFVLCACGTFMKKNQDGAPLEGTTWNLVAVENTPAVVVGSKAIEISFNKKDSRLGGFAGCNTIFASYAADDEAISFGPIGSTKKACKDNVALEDALINGLSQVNLYRIKGNELTLYRGDRLMLKFIAAGH